MTSQSYVCDDIPELCDAFHSYIHDIPELCDDIPELCDDIPELRDGIPMLFLCIHGWSTFKIIEPITQPTCLRKVIHITCWPKCLVL